MSIVTCQICNDQFEAKRSDAKYCSDPCKRAARRSQAAVPKTRERKNAYNSKRMRQKRTENPAKYKQEYQDWYDKYGVEYHRQWRADHPEWGEANLKRVLQRHRDNPKEKKRHDAEHYLRHRDYRRKQVKTWQQENREQIRPVKQAALVRYRARLANAEGDFTAEQFQALCKKTDYCCFYCGTRPDKLTIDHVIPLSRGGTNWITNIVPACLSCNASKRNKTGEEYMRVLKVATS